MRPDSFQSIYLDSCALIAVVGDEPGCEPIRRVLAMADQRQLQVFGSPLILVEVRGQGRGEQDPDVDRKALDILSGARITEVELSRSVAIQAREYVGDYSLKPYDAVHLASAVAAGVDIM